VTADRPAPAPAEPSAAPPSRRHRRWLTTALVAGLLVAMAVSVFRADEELASLERLSIPVLVGALLLQFLSQLFLNGSLLVPLQTSVPSLGFWELYVVRTGGLFLGSLVPVAGGVAVRLAYLRNRGVSYLDFTWATLLSNVLALVAASAIAVVAAGALRLTAGPLPAAVVGITAGVFASSVAAVAVFEYLPQLARAPRFQRWRWLGGMRSLGASRAVAVRVLVLSAIRHCLNFVTFGLLSRALSGVGADFLAGGLVYALTSPARMVNITPGNLGVAEWIVAAVGRMLAFDIATGLIVAIAFRGIGLLAQALGASAGGAWLAVRRRGATPGPQ
jgi:hypothetical protein